MMQEARLERIAFRMQLKAGALVEYRRRHDEIWPELCDALKDAGISDYHIFHDPQTYALFATLLRRKDHAMASLPDLPIMRKWWAMMAPLMVVEADFAPQSTSLDPIFYLA